MLFHYQCSGKHDIDNTYITCIIIACISFFNKSHNMAQIQGIVLQTIILIAPVGKINKINN